MKAIVKKNPCPGLWLEEVPVPKIKDDEVLIKIRKTAICGTDVHIYNWDAWAQKTVPIPLVIGHEFMGEIVALGSQVKDLQIGMRVSGEGHLTCGHCRSCQTGQRHLCDKTIGIGYHRQGVFAEYFSLPAENVFVLPEGIADDLAAILDPFGNAVHTALSFDLTARDVLITGAGPLGCMAAAIARKAGARTVVVTDLNEYRLELARTMGAVRAIHSSNELIQKARKELSIPYGFEIGLEMSGSAAALELQVENARSGGHLALLGILPAQTQIDWDKVIFKMLTIKGIYGREIFSTWYKMIALLESGLDLSPVITHHYPAEEFEKGFQVMLAGQSGKVILNWEK